MASRLNLHAELASVLASVDRPQNVYFQPPESIRMKYPCIVYKRSSGRTTFADNKPYTFEESYEVTVIDRDPDSPIVRALAMHFPKSRYNRHLTVDNLHHDVFVIYWYKNSKEE
jgi:hypothetical protein